jgi:transposase-like protein
MHKESWERAIDEGRPWTDAEAARALAACAASGQSAAQFARRYNLTAGKLYWWRKRLAERSTASSRLLPVSVVSGDRGNAGGNAPPRVVLTDGRLRLEIEGISPEWVAALIRLVRENEA